MEERGTEPQKLSNLNRMGSRLPRRIVLVMILAAGAYLLVPRLAGVTDALRLIREASAPPLAAALACQALSILSHGYVVHRTLSTFGPRMGFWNVLQVMLASGFATVFIPSLGLSGLAVRDRYLGEYGYVTGATVLTFSLEMLGQSAALCLMVMPALLQYALRGQAAPWQALILLAGMVLLGSAFLAFLLSDPHKHDWRYALLELANRIRVRLGRLPIPSSELKRRLTALRQPVRSLTTQAGLRLLLGNLGRTFGMALCLHMTLLAFGRPVPLHVTIISYSLSDVMGGLSSLPAGLLVTETSLTALLANAGVPLPVAVASTLTYRLIALWLPRAIGLGALYNLQRHSDRPLW